MEKSLCLVAVVAFSCGGLPSASAQIQLQGAAHPIQLVNQSSDEQAPEVDENSTIIANPFDFFQDVEAAADAPAPPLSIDEQQYDPTATLPASDLDRSPSDSDPAALPIAKQQRSIVDTIVDQSMVASLPHTAYAPVEWSGMVQTPNPIATLLLRDECNSRALWAGYQAQRAAECQHMWEHLARHSSRAGHAGCGHSGCKQSGCADCGHAPVRNRYLTEAPAAACDVGTAVSPAPAHFDPAPIPAPAAAPYFAPAASAAENHAAPPPPSSSSKVAALPTFQR